jgi:hypothetical protein
MTFYRKKEVNHITIEEKFKRLKELEDNSELQGEKQQILHLKILKEKEDSLNSYESFMEELDYWENMNDVEKINYAIQEVEDYMNYPTIKHGISVGTRLTILTVLREYLQKEVNRTGKSN